MTKETSELILGSGFEHAARKCILLVTIIFRIRIFPKYITPFVKASKFIVAQLYIIIVDANQWKIVIPLSHQANL